MWVVSREAVDFYSTLMVVIETADAPEGVRRLRNEWRALCDAYNDLPELNRATLARGAQTDAETARFRQAHEAVCAFCAQWHLKDTACVIPTGLYCLLLSGETDLRRAEFVVWDFANAPQPPSAKPPFPLWVCPPIESLDEFLQRVKATLRLERRPDLLHRLDELPARPLLMMEWGGEPQRFTPRPPDWVQKLRSEWGLDFAKYETLERIILALCKDYYSYVVRHIGRCYTPPQVRMRNERPLPNEAQRVELYYRETAWVHLLLRVERWRWERILDFLMAQGVVERVPKLSDDYERALARLRKIPARLHRLGL